MTDLLPAAQAPAHGALFYVAAVNLIIWAGLFAYLFWLDRRVKAIEKDRAAHDTPER